MKKFFKKTILLFVLTGIVFLGGGVGVARAADKPSVPQQPATNAGSSPSPNSPVETVDTTQDMSAKMFNTIGCGGTLDMIKAPVSCFFSIISYRLYQVVTWVLMLSGFIFDFMLAMSIDKVFIDRDFVHEIWKVMRDVANMMFIFILLYAGIRTMLLGDDWKKPVMNVVVIALLINFSLFFTNIIIDAGNILAVGVYSNMGVVKKSGSHKTGGVPEHNISETLVNAFAPQKFLTLGGGDSDLAPSVFIIAGIVSGFAAWIFFKAAFMFMGRILAFWFLMMWSPVAFIMFASPQLAKQAKFSFDDWLQMLINQAFVAPVFLFMIYVIMTFIEKGKLLDSLVTPTGAGVSGFFFDNIFAPIVMMAMVIYAFKKSLSVVEGMSGYFGKIGASVGNKVLGLAVGGAGMALTGGIGGLANKALQSGVMQRMAAGEGGETALGRFVGRQGVILADKTRNTSFDARNIKTLGIGKGLGAGEGNKDGFMKKEEKWMKEQQKTAKLMEMTDTEKEEMGGEQRKENIKRKNTAEKTHEEAEEAVNKSAPVKQMRKEKEETKEREGKAVSMAGDASIKKLEAEKRKEAALNGPQKAKAIEELEEASVAEQKALGELRDARKDAENARDAYDSNSEVKALEEAAKTLNELRKIVTEDKKVIKERSGEINDRRRETYGKSATLTHPSSWWDKAKKIDKIRKGPSGKEQADEDMSKWWKKMTEKEKKERGEPATAKEKSEKPKEEESPRTE